MVKYAREPDNATKSCKVTSAVIVKVLDVIHSP